jgi:hypothetical protein
METNKCPKCGSDRVTIERRIDGDCLCNFCGYKWKNQAMTELEKITQGIPLDRLKELCEAYRLVGKRIFSIDPDNLDWGIWNVQIERMEVTEEEGIKLIFPIGNADYEIDENDFYGDNALERAEQRLAELRGEK